MTCRDAEVLLSPALDEALEAHEERRLRSHLAECAACTRRLDRLRAARDAFRLGAPVAATTSVRSGRRRLPVRAAVAVAAVVAVAFAGAMLSRTPPVEAPTADPHALTSMEFLPAEPQAEASPCYRAADCGVDALTRTP